MRINTSSPQYQRWMQKANAMAQDDPNRFRILMNLTNDKFAGDVMRKRIANLGTAIKQQGRERSHKSAGRRLGFAKQRHGLAEQRHGLRKRTQAANIAFRDRETSDALKTMREARTLGYLRMIPAAMSGVSKYRQGMDEANLMRRLTENMDAGNTNNAGLVRNLNRMYGSY